MHGELETGRAFGKDKRDKMGLKYLLFTEKFVS